MKTTLNFKGLISILLVTLCCQCEKLAMDKSYEINLVNKTRHNIGYYFALGGKYGTFYPDSLPKTNDYIVYDISKVLRPGCVSHLNWESVFQQLPKDTLSVYVFSNRYVE